MSSSFIMSKEKRYLVKIDGDAFGIASSLDKSNDIINSLAIAEEIRLSSMGFTVFRKNQPLEIQLHTYQKGFLGRTLVKEMEFTICEINQIHSKSPYADKIAKYKAEKGL